MTPVVDAITNEQPYEGNLAIIVGNGKVLKVTHIGNVQLTIGNDVLDLKNTLCFPNLRKNLISIQRLTFNYPIEFSLSANKFSLINV